MCGATFYPATTPVEQQAALQRAAQRHSADMADNLFFSHSGSDGSSPGTRVSDSGYTYRQVAENIAAGQPSIHEVQAGWLGSPGHCSAIMEPAFTDIGIACVSNPDSELVRYWSAVYGKPL